MTRHVEDGTGQEQPISDDDGHIEIEGGEGVSVRFLLEVQRRADLQPELFGRRMNGGGRQRQAATARLARRLGIDGGDSMASVMERAKGRHGEVGRAHESEGESHGPVLAPDVERGNVGRAGVEALSDRSYSARLARVI